MDDSPGSDLLRLLLKRWWVLVAGMVIGGLLGFAALQVIQPTYSTTATQLIKGVPGSGTGANYLAAQFAVARAKSYPAFIYSTVVLDAVRADMGPQYTDARLREQLSANNPTDTPLVQVTATGATAKEAQDLANSASRHLARFITQIETVDGSTPVIVETAVQAGLPSQPSEPQPALVMALGVTGGFAVAVIIVLGWGYLGRRKQVSARSGSEVGQTLAEPAAVAVDQPDEPAVADLAEGTEGQHLAARPPHASLVRHSRRS